MNGESHSRISATSFCRSPLSPVESDAASSGGDEVATMVVRVDERLLSAAGVGDEDVAIEPLVKCGWLNW